MDDPCRPGRQACAVREAAGPEPGRGACHVRRRAPGRRDAARGLPLLVPAADRAPGRAAADGRHRTRDAGAGQLRLHAAQPRQHPHEARDRWRCAARCRQLPGQLHPPGDGLGAAPRVGAGGAGGHRRGPGHHRHAGLGRRPPGTAALRHGRGAAPPCHRGGQRRPHRDRVSQPHGRCPDGPPPRLPAEPDARAPRRGRGPDRDRGGAHRQRLPLCCRGLCPRGGRGRPRASIDIAAMLDAIAASARGDGQWVALPAA